MSDDHDQRELDLAIDYRALEPVETSYGPAFALRELGANKVLAIFDRAEPRNCIDLAELTKRFPLEELIALAADKDPGLDLAVLEHFMNRAGALPAADFELDDRSYAQLLDMVHSWQVRIGQPRRRELDQDRSPANGGTAYAVDDDRSLVFVGFVDDPIVARRAERSPSSSPSSPCPPAWGSWRGRMDRLHCSGADLLGKPNEASHSVAHCSGGLQT